ncbi:hypothetical protein CLF_103916 [Clonorchis sinensis]|uniref:Uncharacterized protein n=1 Tax=Clonorchis sinensis TaxID=79923 RepID=G7YAM2_CLOSI|nr:hypothetical protein CLF_103916 [Clonorchis sinensis]
MCESWKTKDTRIFLQEILVNLKHFEATLPIHSKHLIKLANHRMRAESLEVDTTELVIVMVSSSGVIDWSGLAAHLSRLYPVRIGNSVKNAYRTLICSHPASHTAKLNDSYMNIVSYLLQLPSSAMP